MWVIEKSNEKAIQLIYRRLDKYLNDKKRQISILYTESKDPIESNTYK